MSQSQIQTVAGLNTYALIVGSAASNCGGGTEDLTVTLGGSLTLADSWSQTLSVGLTMGSAADGLSLTVTGSTTWSKSQSVEEDETFTISIPPQRQVSCTASVMVSLTCHFQGALVALVTYNSTNGTLQIGNG